MNSDTGEFVPVRRGDLFINDVVEGIFRFGETNSGNTVMTYEAVSIKPFSIVFGFYHKKAWRLRFCLVVSQSNGIILFPMTKTLFIDDEKIQVPAEMRGNTALVFGFHSKADAINLAFRVFANNTGYVNENPFNGYEGDIVWNRSSDTITYPDCIKGGLAKKKCFSVILSRENGAHQVVGELREQRLVELPLQSILTLNNESEEVCFDSFSIF